MGGEPSKIPEYVKQNFATGSSRLKEYLKSKEVLISQLTNDPISYLRPGDILSRKLNVTTTSKSGSYSGDGGGLGIHYAIYYQYSSGSDTHLLVEKSDRKSDYVQITYESSYSLLTNYKLVVDSRYKDTLDMALWLYISGMDSGYSFTHSNCEHFVTFCLTRFNSLSVSKQVLVPAFIKDLFAEKSIIVGNALKLLSHPFYLIGGDFTLEERCIKTAVPFGFDGSAIAKKQKLFIGSSGRAIPMFWIPFDVAPEKDKLRFDFG